MLFVSLLVVLSTVFVGVGSAAALIQLAVPIAATALRIAPSMVKVVGGKSLVSPATTAIGGGIAMAAAGLYEAMRPQFHDDESWLDKMGVKMPWDVKAELGQTSTREDSSPSRHADATMTTYEWVELEFEGATYPTIQIEATCRAATEAGGPYCDEALAGTRSVGTMFWQCENAATGERWEQSTALDVGAPLRGSIGRPPCFRSSQPKVIDQVVSGQAVNTGRTTQVRLANPFDVFNPSYQGPEPAGTITATVQCVDPDGNQASYSVTGDNLDTMPVAACPSGHTPQKIGWTADTPTGTRDMGGAEYDYSEFPECADMSCILQVKVDGIPCHVGVERCYDWMRVEPKNRVECQYGPYALGLAQCRDLEWAYRSGAGMTPSDAPAPGGAPALNPDGTPNTDAPTRLVPSDPEGKPAPEVGPGTPWQPDPHPPTQPDPPGEPDPPPSTVQPPPPVWNPPVVGNPPDLENPTKNCIQQMASWNPVDWVYIPMKCALSWAFVPKPEAAATLTATATGVITDGGLGDWMGVPAGLVATIPEGGGCRGPEVSMPEPLGGGTIYPFDACHEPMSKAAEMTRAFISLVAVVAGAYSIMNSLSLSLTGYRMIEPQTKTVST